MTTATRLPPVPLLVASVMLVPIGALADATLHAGSQTYFPSQIAVVSSVKAQVEITSVTLSFTGIQTTGDFTLTVPSPEAASSIGVEIDRGGGFESVPISGRAPPPGVGSGPQSTAAVRAWEGKTPLLATLAVSTGSLEVRVHFLRLLRRHAAAVVFEVGADRCPLRDASNDPTVTLSVALQTLRPIAEVFVQGVPSKVSQPSSVQAAFSYGPAKLSASARATVTYREQSSGINARLLAHRTPDADPLGGAAGYFMLVLDADNAGAAASPPRTLNLAIDRSGSMQGDKIAQAHDAAMAMLENLRPTDRFNIHAFSDGIWSWQNAAVPADSAHINEATAFVHNLYAGGSTDLNAGILAGLGHCTAGNQTGRFDAMVLLSDGKATTGVTDRTTIHQNAIANNCNEARIFTFAVGQDADTALLEAVARSSRAKTFTLNDAQANADLSTAVRQLFEDIYAVRLTDITLTLGGNGAHQVLPEKALDLFDGGQVLLVGRYNTPGQGSVHIAAKATGSSFKRELAFNAPKLRQDNAFIKYVWATEKVGALLAKLGSGAGDPQRIEEEITEIGLGYSIQTPYTSFVSAPSPSTPPSSTPPSSTPPSSTPPSSSPSPSGGGGGGGGGGMGDVDPISLGLLALLFPSVRRRLSKKAR